MKKTKIVCTMGPSTDNEELLAKMLQAGMDVARFNFSHGNHEEQKKRIELVRKASEKVGKPIALMADTKGPEVRLGMFKGDKVKLEVGKEFILTTDVIEGTSEKATVNYENLPQEVKPQEQILLDDGKLTLEVIKTEGNLIYTKVVHGGMVSSRKRVAVPGAELNMPFMSEQDKKDIEFAIANNMDYIATSFTRKADDVLAVRKVLELGGSNMGIIAKIENREGLNNLKDILRVAEGVMVARGDLGVEIPAEEVPIVQKQMIALGNAMGKPVITATQMLESMITSYRATRAEASDVANSIFDGTDAIMLSGETASGQYPLEAVETMAKIAEKTESALDYVSIFKKKGMGEQVSTADAISHATVQVAQELEADQIVSITESGYTARMISKYKPQVGVIGVSPKEENLRKMQLYWGVYPLLGPYSDNTDEIIDLSLNAAKEANIIQAGDMVVVTAGVPVGKVGSTNLIKVMNLGEKLLKGVSVGKNSVTGKVCKVERPEDISKFTPGDILVVPGIVNETAPIAAKAKGIIAEEGGFTSSAAIVAINCGISTIVGAEGAMATLQDGQEITMDMGSGTVYDGKINVK